MGGPLVSFVWGWTKVSNPVGFRPDPDPALEKKNMITDLRSGTSHKLREFYLT